MQNSFVDWRSTISAVGAIAIVMLTGCASAPSVPLPNDVQQLEHQFILEKDDRASREGAYPTYALLERDPAGHFRTVAFSKRFIPMTRANQEQFFISKNFTNVVPAWNGYSVEYHEDPVTGKRRDVVFSSQSSDRRVSYTPDDSVFSYLAGQQVMPTMVGRAMVRNTYLNIKALKNAIAESNVLTEARAWSAGTKTYRDSAPQVSPLLLPQQVWEISGRGEGENGRYYFVPSKLTTRFGEYVDVGSSVYFERVQGLATRIKTPLDSMKRFKVYRWAPPSRGENFGCVDAIMDVDSQQNLDQRFCGSGYALREWSMPVMAKSPTLGEITVWAAEGQAYRRNGSSSNMRTLRLDVGGTNAIQEFRVLPPSEAAQLLATFK